MAVRLERKIFTCFKWFIILIPIFITAFSYVSNCFQVKYDYERAKLDGYIEWYQDNQGVDYYEDMTTAPSITSAFNGVMGQINTYLPKFSYSLGSSARYSANLMLAIYDTTFHRGNFAPMTSSSLWGCIMTYLSYVIQIEIIFMCIYLFRFFIHFFINLFERKQDI